jgi:hypothetical protein
MNVWDSLPNAKHIDCVIESVKKHPDEWHEAWYAAYGAAWDVARVATYDVARDALRNSARDAVWYAAWYAAWDATYDVARDALRNSARDAVWDSILALVAYDDCEKYLDMSYNELLFIAKLTEIPATILLLPYTKAMVLIREKV